ncbi:MAG TPA: helix-hairpin-helix domain-containing protein [Candidatus Krumholzibacteria bacterium]|nr:helix-hairpin-helix domain-containing protein [Candidatus Krumholzibacteria bacterium]HRX51290.1 helix-hairpin-helix domain-containing protein [Candidatus Krumholzibacteria bacterium]
MTAKPKKDKPAPAAAPAKAAKKAEAATAKAADATDDLTKIEGIGPKFALAFQSVGVATFADLAAKSVDELKALLEGSEEYASLAGRVGDTWPKQAEMAAAGQWDELKAWQDELDGGREAK